MQQFKHWVYHREIAEHLTSDLPTNKGVTISGCQGTGKTSIILQLVENSCFGNKYNDAHLLTGERNSTTAKSFKSYITSLFPDNSMMTESIYGTYGTINRQPQKVTENSLQNLASQVVAYHFCQVSKTNAFIEPNPIQLSLLLG